MQESLIMLLAGPVASSKFTKEGLKDHISSDYRKCFDLIGNLFGNERIEAAYLNYVIEETKALMNTNGKTWKLCKAISKELLKNETLLYSDCINVAKCYYTYLQ